MRKERGKVRYMHKETERVAGSMRRVAEGKIRSEKGDKVIERIDKMRARSKRVFPIREKERNREGERTVQ